MLKNFCSSDFSALWFCSILSPNYKTGWTLFYQPKFTYFLLVFVCQSLHPDAMTLLRLSAGYFCAFRRFPASRIQDLNERFWSLCLRIAVANPRRGADAPLYSTSFITWGLVPPSEKCWKRHWIVCIISSDFMRTMVVPFMKHYLCVGIYVTAITITIYTLTQSACS